MNPRDFYNAFGPCKVTEIQLPAAETIVIPFDIDRYLLVFLTNMATTEIAPAFTNTMPGAQILLEQQTPMIFTHALHGSLVNMAWLGRDPGALLPLVIITASQAGPTSILNERRDYAQRKADQQRSTTHYRSKRNGSAKSK